MAVLNTFAPTLLDLATRLDPNGSVATIVELLSQTNPILEDASWFQGNLPTGHRTTQRTGLAQAAFRALNAGGTVGKTSTAQIDEGAGLIELWSEVDCKLAELGGNTAAFRFSESQGIMESVNQFMAQNLFYGNVATNPLAFNGFATRYNSPTVGQQAQNVLSSGTVTGGDGTSIWLVGWGVNTVSCFFPQGSQAGLIHEDKGRTTIQTAVGAATGRLDVYQDKFSWSSGLCVRDWRYAVRGCNIDVSNLAAEAGAADLVKLMVKMIHRIPHLGMCRPVFYMSRTPREMLDIQAMNKASSQITVENVAGKLQTSFRGIPIRTCDAILETEAQLT